MAAVRGVRSWLATGDWGQYRKHPWWAALLFGPAVAAVAALIAGAAWRTLIVPGPDGATVIPVQHASSSRPPPLPPHRAASARPSAPARPSATRRPPRPAEVVPRDTSSAPAPTWPASSNRPSPSSPVPALSSPPSLPPTTAPPPSTGPPSSPPPSTGPPSSPPPSTGPPTTEPPSPGESPPPRWPP